MCVAPQLKWWLGPLVWNTDEQCAIKGGITLNKENIMIMRNKS